MRLFEKLSWKIRHFRAGLQFRKAIEKAEKAHSESGKRFYIMPDASGKLIVLDRKNFRLLRMKHYIPHSEKMKDALRCCFYFTAQGDETGFMSPETRLRKEKMFFDWIDEIHNNKKKK